MKTTTITIFFALFSLLVFSQVIPYSSFGRGVATTFETDYHCLGINTSALGWGSGYNGKSTTFSTSETNLSLNSPALDKQKFSNFSKIIRTQINNKQVDSASALSVLNSTADYAKSGVQINGNVQWLGFSFQNKKIGGIAVSIAESYGLSSKINLNSATALFQGQWQNLIDSVTITKNGINSRVAFNQNMSPDSLAAISSTHLAVPLDLNAFTNGSNTQILWNRNFNIGYGRKLFGMDSIFAFYGGIGFRYIQAMAYYNMVSDVDGLRVSSSFSPAAMSNGGIITQINPLNSSSIGGLFSKPVGKGYGIDLSASIIIANKLRIALAINDLGSVKYERFNYIANPTISQEIAVDGIEPNYSTKTVQELIKGAQLLVPAGKETFTLANATNLRMGASWIPIKQFHFGVDVVAPFHSNNALSLQNPIFALGLDARPLKWISLNVGLISGGIYTGSIPVGINFILKNGGYEFGISSNDIVHFLTKNGNNVSAAFGFARIRI